MLLTVIVPVYNVENYIAKCIESVIYQRIESGIELILVDDGSNDSSGKICDEYASKYNWIKTFHLQNGGVGRARNFGILQARGKYIQFIDSDDFLEYGLYERFSQIVKEHNDIDACFFGLKDYPHENKTRGHCIEEGLYTEVREEEMKYSGNLSDLYISAKKEFLLFFPTTKFFKSSIIKEEQIRFREDIHYYEDYLFNLQFFYYVNKVYAIGGKAYYNYVHHPGEHLGGKFTPPSIITGVAKDIYTLSERLPLSQELHKYNVMEYYNNLLHAIDCTYNSKAIGSEAKTKVYIHLWLSEISRLGYKSEFIKFLGKRKTLLAFENVYSVYVIESIRMFLLRILKI